MQLEDVEPQEVNVNIKYVTTPGWARTPDDGIYKKVLLIVVAVCTLVFVASMVVLASSQGVRTGSLSTAGEEEDISRSIRQDARGWGKIWMIAVGHDWGAFEYINSTGHLSGFEHDLIREVCTAAGIRCATVWEWYFNCMDFNNYPAKGLMGKWYDACPGWMATLRRLQVYDFSVDFAARPPVHFFSKPGNTNFNHNDIRGKTIVFMDGWAADPECLARQRGFKGNILAKPQVLYAYSTQEFYDTIINSTADAGFASDDVVRKYVTAGKLKQVGPVLICSVGGNAVMTRKDSTFNTHWNRGFEIIYSNGRYKKLCDSVTTKHAGQGHVTCVGV